MNIGLGFSGSSIPIYAGLDYWTHEHFSIGGEIGWRRLDKIRFLNKDYHQDLYSFSVNGNYHFAHLLDLPKEIDTYAGLNVGFFHYSDNVDGDYEDNDHTSGLGLGLQLGIKYYFKSNLAVYLELNGGNQVSDGKIGISIKF